MLQYRFHYRLTACPRWILPVFLKGFAKCHLHKSYVEKCLDTSIELPIPKLFICLIALFFYSSLRFFSSEGSAVGGGLNGRERTEGFQVSGGKGERVREGMWIIDQREEEKVGKRWEERMWWRGHEGKEMGRNWYEEEVKKMEWDRKDTWETGGQPR